MSMLGFSQARRGRRATRGNFTGVEELKYEPGKFNRVVIPLRKDEDGNESVILFGQTVHHLNNPKILKMPRSNGGYYSPYTFRCTHPYSQQTDKDALTLAKRREMCVLCEIENLQNRRRLSIMEQEFGTEEEDYEDAFDNFKELSRGEKRAFYQKNELDVERSYFKKEDDDGNEFTQNTREMYLLLLELVLEEKSVRVKNRRTQEVRVVKRDVVKLDEEGLPEYRPVLFKVSGKRLNAFKTAVDTALQTETLSYDNVYPYLENEGTDMEEEVSIGWVDFQLSFPDGKRVDSAKDMTITAVPDEQSSLVVHGEFKEKLEGVVDEFYKNASNTVDNVYLNLKMYKRDEVMALLDKDFKAEFEQLREEYRTEADDEFENEVYDNVLGDLEGKDMEEDEVEDEERDVGKKGSKKGKGRKSSKGKKGVENTKSVKGSKGKTTGSKGSSKGRRERIAEKEQDELDADILLDDEDLLG